MKKLKLSILLITTLLLSACSDENDKDDIKVPAALSEALTAKYPNATAVEWKQKGNYLVADCRVNGQEKDVWFNTRIEWLLTETELLWNDLPTTVQRTFNNSKYAFWEIEKNVHLEYSEGTIRFVIEVEKGKTDYQLFYSETGYLIQTKDVTNKDDTHWPMVMK